MVVTRRGVLASATLIAVGGPALAAAPLRGAVDVARRRALVSRPTPFTGCPSPVSPQRDVQLSDVYTDAAYSVIDPARLKRYQDAVQVFGTFSVTVARQSDIWLASNPPQQAAGLCLLSWLDRWASAGAMLGNVSAPSGEHERKWTLAGAALAYLKVRDAPGLDPAAKRRVEQWFAEMAIASRTYYMTWNRTSYNNHIYWMALALAATAVTTNDRSMFDSAVDFYCMALDDIQPDGTLPLEMGRKARAFAYHIFSLMPLVMIAELGEANGLGLYAEKNGALHRLARRVQDGLVDLSWFTTHAGPQDDEHPANQPRNLAWAEPYYARFPNPTLGQLVAAKRPIFYHWFGGNVTNDFGSPNLPLH